LEFHDMIGSERKEKRLHYLKNYWFDKVKDIPKVKLHTSFDPKWGCAIGNVSVEGKKVAIIGDILHSRVALSNIFCLQKLGAEVMVCGPSTLIPKYIGGLGVKVSHHLREALEWCDVANLLRIQLERQDIRYFPSLREYIQLFGVNKAILDSLSKPITIMHPGPINRGVEITSEVADSSDSIILQQVENGVAIRMAVLYLLAGQNS